jgi:hypothetical protein
METAQLSTMSRMRKQLLTGDISNLDHGQLHYQLQDQQQSPLYASTPPPMHHHHPQHQQSLPPGQYPPGQYPPVQPMPGQPMLGQAAPQQQQQQQQQQSLPGQYPGQVIPGARLQSMSSMVNTSYDMFTPPTVSTSSSRKASLTSQSGINRFFKRNKSQNDNLNFNEDAGVDIGELTNGVNISLNDITHMRDRGAYSMNSKNRIEDTTPLIPVVGGPISPASKTTNNVQYRKQMNQQMKMAYASGARAMSMNNQLNPINEQNFVNNPNQTYSRTMTFNSFGGQGPRTMSLMSNNFNNSTNVPPSKLSFSSNGGYPLGQNQIQSQRNNSMNNYQTLHSNAPKAMSMRNMPASGAPGFRTMSLNNPSAGLQNQMNQYPPKQVIQGKPMVYQTNPSQQRFPGQNHTPGPGSHPNQLQNQLPGTNQQQSGVDAFGFNSNQPNLQVKPGQIQNQMVYQNQGQSQSPNFNNGKIKNQSSNYNENDGKYHYTQSNESLTNVPEEEEETITRKSTLAPERKYPAFSLPFINGKYSQQSESQFGSGSSPNLLNITTTSEDEEYKSETDNDGLSRKSTLKKSNSVRLRKLDLFNNKQKDKIAATSEESDEETTTPDGIRSEEETEASPNFNARNSNERYSIYMTDEEEYSNRDNYRTIGASAANKSNATNLTNDVFVTACDFNSPKKDLTGSDSNLINNDNGKSSSNEYNFDRSEEEHNLTDDTDDTVSANNAPAEDAGIYSNLSKNLNKYKSLTTNTAFSNFRSISGDNNANNNSSISNKGDETPKLDSGFDCDKTPKFSVQSTFAPEQPAMPIHSDKGSLNSSLYSSSSLGVDQTPGYTYSQESLEKSSNSRDFEYSSYTTNESAKVISGSSNQINNESINSSPNTYVENNEPKPKSQPAAGRNSIGSIAVSKRRHSDFKKSPSLNSKPFDAVVQSNSTNFATLEQNYHQPMNIPEQIETKLSNSHKTTIIGSSYSPAGVESPTGDNKRGSRTMSLSNKSKNFFRKLSGRKASIHSNDSDIEDSESSRLTHYSQSIGNDANSNLRSYSTNIVKNQTSKSHLQPQIKPLHFTKEELGIMTCNNDLVTELELVTTELASSIRRELALESKIKNNLRSSGQQSMLDDEYEDGLALKAKAMIDLQEKLNKERRLRFISEEHALMLEHGQEPSALKINYEKNEIYKQLLIKNDMVNQLEDKLAEYESMNGNESATLLDKYNELLKENTDLKFRVIPELERQYGDSEKRKTQSFSKSLKLTGDDSFDSTYDESQEEILKLKSQREDLRETVSKLTSNHNYVLSQANDRIRNLEQQVQNLKLINDKLTKRVNSNSTEDLNSTGNRKFQTSNDINGSLAVKNKGGKMQGFSIVSPRKNLFG